MGLLYRAYVLRPLSYSKYCRYLILNDINPLNVRYYLPFNGSLCAFNLAGLICLPNTNHMAATAVQKHLWPYGK